jgi:hypothetical protein
MARLINGEDAFPVHVTATEFDTILAALRFWQSQPCRDSMAEMEIATNNDQHEPLEDGEIDDLCERINTAAHEPEPRDRAATIFRNLLQLPAQCAARYPGTKAPILIDRGVDGYTPLPAGLDVDAWNEGAKVTPQQVQAMLAGSMFGWHVPGADPSHY